MLKRDLTDMDRMGYDFETKRNETKRNETKRNETKRNETKRNAVTAFIFATRKSIGMSRKYMGDG